MLSAKLRIVGGVEGNEEIELVLPARIGRSQANEITLTQPLVSRHHCEIFALHDRLWVRDLQSTNGTYVGSLRIEGEGPIKPGELLTVGTVTFRALYGELLETDASGFLTHTATEMEQETVNLADAGTVVERDNVGKRTSLIEQVRADVDS